jgi:hypothetical protein
LSSSLALRGVPNLTIRTTLRLPRPSDPKPGYLLQPSHSDAIDVFDTILI